MGTNNLFSIPWEGWLSGLHQAAAGQSRDVLRDHRRMGSQSFGKRPPSSTEGACHQVTAMDGCLPARASLAGAPITQQQRKVLAVDDAIQIEVVLRVDGSVGIRLPGPEEESEIGTVHDPVAIEVSLA